ncbi:MAG TPA: transferrin receptor-like dimerization domain-containing protein [Vicinamibacterales bacterium]|nr:transferrin receptor-like dimerization domain-containing protein [Vicinamibacterales bacterium]
MTRSRTLVVALAFSFVGAAPLLSQAPAPLRGFTSKAADAELRAEQKFRAIPKAENLREYMETISEDPHNAGSPNSRKVAEYILSKFQSWGLNASIEQFQALMPYPTERVVELVAPEKYEAKLKEPPVPEDKDSADAGQLPTFNAYSADGDVTADLVYVNYGIPSDYDELAKLGIDVKGKIVIARYGQSWRGIKPKVAYEHGAVGCIIYSDPREDGYFPGDVYPVGAYRPEQGVQRGSVMDMPVYPGDPLTPGHANEPGAAALDRSDAKTLLKIPVLPISYGDALPLMRNLKGPVAPEHWRGALPITYHVGPGPAKVHLKLAFDWQVRPLYDVIAKIDGSTYPDQWVIHGNHHDAWVNGASDPTSGQVSLMEEARAFGELLKTGWRPKRTIVLAAWDGEEWGLLGSTEWAEKHQDELMKKAAVYINSDDTGKGWLGMSGSHSLQAFINDVARDIQDPKRGKSLLEAKREHAIEQAKTDADKKKVKDEKDMPIGALGSGSDYTAFLDYLTVASLSLEFGGESNGGIYHSVYDSYYWFTHFSDTDFAYTTALSKTIGTAMMRLADADVLPFEFTASAKTFRGYVDEIEKLRKETKGAPTMNFAPLRASIDHLEKAGAAYDRVAGRVAAADPKALTGPQAAELNRLLYTTERAFRYQAGLPKREWFKHLAYAPGLYTGYGVKTLPGIREGIEQKDWDDARKYIGVDAQAIDTLAAQVDKATEALQGLVGR